MTDRVQGREQEGGDEGRLAVQEKDGRPLQEVSDRRLVVRLHLSEHLSCQPRLLHLGRER